MQKIITLPEHGWSKFNQVVGGYGINRSFVASSTYDSTRVGLPSLTEMYQFLNSDLSNDFTADEKKAFLDAKMFRKWRLDPDWRASETPAFIVPTEGDRKIEFLTPADVFDSWLRNPSAWKSSRFKAVSDGQESFLTWTVKNRFDGHKFFTDYLFPHDEEVTTIAAFSMYRRTTHVEYGLNPVLDVARIPFSALYETAKLTDGGDTALFFRQLEDFWQNDMDAIIDALSIIDVHAGIITDYRLGVWALLIMRGKISTENARLCIDNGISYTQSLSYINRGIDAALIPMLVAHDIDIDLAQSISNPVLTTA
jgi:hypothetical protein